MIILGLILLLIGFFTGIYFLWITGVILLIVGLVLLIAGHTGHAVGSRNHYW
jgi:membrane-bound ClpP family serine protease